MHSGSTQNLLLNTVWLQSNRKHVQHKFTWILSVALGRVAPAQDVLILTWRSRPGCCPDRTRCSTGRWIRLPESTGARRGRGCPDPWSRSDTWSFQPDSPGRHEGERHSQKEKLTAATQTAGWICVWNGLLPLSGHTELHLFSLLWRNTVDRVVLLVRELPLCRRLLEDKQHVRHSVSPWGCTALRSESTTVRQLWRWWRAASGPCHSSPCTETQRDTTLNTHSSLVWLLI